MKDQEQPAGIPYPLQRGEGVYLYHYPRFDALDEDELDDNDLDLDDDELSLPRLTVVDVDDEDDWDDDLLPGKYDRDLMDGSADDDDESPRRKWTIWRIIAMILILLALISLILYQFYGIIVDPIRVPELPPPPTSAI
jgi:hypothetical protein